MHAAMWLQKQACILVQVRAEMTQNFILTSPTQLQLSTVIIDFYHCSTAALKSFQ